MNLMVSTPLRDDFVGLVDSFSKPNRVVLSVEDGVIELHEGVTEDEHVLVVMSEDSKRHHRDSAFLLSSPVLSPVVRGQVKVLSINHEGHFRILEFISILAVPVALEVLVFTLLEIFDGPRGETHQRCSRVRSNSTLFSLAEAETLSVNLDIL